MPSAIMAALNGMTYVSTSAQYLDTINITLFDGAGGLCLDNSQLGPGSVRTGCFVTSVSVRVNVLGYAGMAAGVSAAATSASASAGLAVLTTMPMQVNVVGGVLGALMVLLTLRCCYQRVCCFYKKTDIKDAKSSSETKGAEGGERSRRKSDCDVTMMMSDPSRSRPIRYLTCPTRTHSITVSLVVHP